MRNIIQSGMAIALLSFILFHNNVLAQGSTVEERVYIQIEIKGLACPFCAYGMEKKLKKISGVDSVEIELRKGLAYISTPKSQQPTKEDLVRIVTDAGFTASVIEYSKSPFERTKEK